jgi:inositol-phosphate phosphatase/L-galactose 1-phosphate phosphatase/histidinol-phosphatase
MTSELDPFVDLAERMAERARAAILPHFRAGVSIETKADDSPVTIADREAERVMRELIEAEYPGHGIEGEEWGAKPGDGGGWVWYLDPIDGTKSFICGIPLFGTLIALARGGKPVLGVIDQPYIGERWLGVAGRRSTFNGKEISVAACPSLAKARFFTTGMEYYDPAQAEAVNRLQAEVSQTRYSADCYGFAMVAEGAADIAAEGHVHEYDVAAVVPVIEGAGGIVTDWDGAPLRFERQGDIANIIACGDRDIHQAALKLLQIRS